MFTFFVGLVIGYILASPVRTDKIIAAMKPEQKCSCDKQEPQSEEKVK